MRVEKRGATGTDNRGERMGAARLKAGTSVDRKQRATWWTDSRRTKGCGTRWGTPSSGVTVGSWAYVLEFRNWFRETISFKPPTELDSFSTGLHTNNKLLSFPPPAKPKPEQASSFVHFRNRGRKRPTHPSLPSYSSLSFSSGELAKKRPDRCLPGGDQAGRRDLHGGRARATPGQRVGAAAAVAG